MRGGRRETHLRKSSLTTTDQDISVDFPVTGKLDDLALVSTDARPSGNFLGLVVDCCPYTHATHTTSDKAKVSEHEKASVAVPQMFITTNNLCNYNRFILFHISLGLYLKSSFMFLFL
uniref:Uncharacterized protein n=1 Tax=Timema poppense TaxID=170557 RepID=A0A7R9H5U5_TIMPO|nr:unnamed protein product [Timema poppensis]